MEHDLRELDADALAAEMSELLKSLAITLSTLGEEMDAANEAYDTVVIAGAAAQHAYALFGKLELAMGTDGIKE